MGEIEVFMSYLDEAGMLYSRRRGIKVMNYNGATSPHPAPCFIPFHKEPLTDFEQLYGALSSQRLTVDHPAVEP